VREGKGLLEIRGVSTRGGFVHEPTGARREKKTIRSCSVEGGGEEGKSGTEAGKKGDAHWAYYKDFLFEKTYQKERERGGRKNLGPKKREKKKRRRS